MSYPGNGELSQEIQERVLSTFEHTLQLVEQDSRDEALLGCDFILRLDPLYEPARILQDRLHRSEGAVHDLEIDDLAAATESARRGPAEVPAPEGLGATSSLAAAPREAESDSPSVEELQDALARHLDRRELEQVIELAQGHRETVAMDPLLQKTVEAAQGRLEAEPYVASFLDAAEQAMAAGDSEKAAGQIEKARALDSTHPRIETLEGKLESGDPDPISDLGTGSADSFASLGDEFASPDGDDDLSDLGLDFGTELDDGLSFGFDEEALTTQESVADDDPDQRIEELLTEGQQAFEANDYQGAIDAWSRIFLIDIDHGEANQRIEQARKLKAESDRALEEILHDGLTRLEAGDHEGARAYLEKVIERQPEHLEALEGLQKLDAGPEAATTEPPGPADDDTSSLERPAPRPQEDRPPQTPTLASPPKKRSPSARFLAIGGLVLALAGAGAWYLVSHWDSMFPNSKPQTGAVGTRATDPIEGARQLHEAGKIQEAIAQLRRLPPVSPDYAEAQALIAQWESVPARGGRDGRRALRGGLGSTGRAPATGSARPRLRPAHRGAGARRAGPPPSGPSTATIRRFEVAYAGGDRAPQAPARAVPSRRLGVRPSPDLWLLYDAEPESQDVRRLIVDSYYNLGVRDLQRGLPGGGGQEVRGGPWRWRRMTTRSSGSAASRRPTRSDPRICSTGSSSNTCRYRS